MRETTDVEANFKRLAEDERKQFKPILLPYFLESESLEIALVGFTNVQAPEVPPFREST